MKKIVLSISLLCICLSVSVNAQDKIRLVVFATGLSNPVGMANAGDERLFVIEKRGFIRILDTAGNVSPVAFLDIDARVNSGASERGLLGLAFHPDYAANGYFYVNYTNSGGHTVVARFSRDSLNSDIGDPDSEQILLTINQPFSNHNGGHLAFGPDGYLYIGTGDGGDGGDPGDRAQDGQELLGKMLRLDVDSASPFAIPPDNPFIENDTILDEIWAIGLRNPWRYSFDRVTGDLWIADVGQDDWEEVSMQPAGSPGGENYGWRCYEGFEVFNDSGCPPENVMTPPVYVYRNGPLGCSITGGYVYRGIINEYLTGKFIYTDYCEGRFGAVWIDEEGNVEDEVLANIEITQFTSFGEDIQGELYVAGTNGIIYHVEDLVSSVSDQSLDQKQILPNPAFETFVIQSDDEIQVAYHIYDQSGRMVSSGKSATNQEIECSQLMEGVYLVEWNESVKHVAKLVVLKR